MGKLGLVGVVLSVVALAGCAAEVEKGVGGEDELRADPNAMVPTTDPNVRLLSGYNAFLDRATPTPCIEPLGQTTMAGDVRGSFYLRHVKTREDLAKELDVELGASVKAPLQGSVDASTKVVKTFKSSTTTVTFLVRAVRSYVVTNTSPLKLTGAARAMLEENKNSEFLRTCGASFAQSVRYEAQVLGMLQFEAKSEESARTIEAAMGGATPSAKQDIAPGGSVNLKTKAQETASKNNASLSITVTAAGFLSEGKAVTADVAENSFEAIDTLYKDMARSFDADLAADRANYFTHQRNVRPAILGQASYSAVSDAPSVDYSALSTTLAKAEEFVGGYAPLYLRMEQAYEDEVMRFLRDPQNQYNYNLAQGPKLKTSDLTPIAQTWAKKFGPDGAQQNGSLVAPLRLAIDRCTTGAASGNYAACANDPRGDADKQAAEAALGEYARKGRILPLAAWMPVVGKTMSYYNAEGTCAEFGMRLAKEDELGYIAPAVSALAGPAGEVWYSSTASCGAPVFRNSSGEGKRECGSSWYEWMPWIADRPVLCVSRSGPMPARPAP